jgi:hypothetical protein
LLLSTAYQKEVTVSEPLTLEVTTQVYGLGTAPNLSPVYVLLTERTLTARELVAEHVRAELQRATVQRSSSLALHYLLDDDLHADQLPAATPTSDSDQEIARALHALQERRYLLVVDGTTIDRLDAPLTITERSQVQFVRLLPLIGG